MPIKKFNQLSDKQKMEVYRRYTDTTTLDMYLYNFDEKGNYVNRQYNPEGMTIYNDPVENKLPVDPFKNRQDEIDEEIEKIKEQKKPKRTKKK